MPPQVLAETRRAWALGLFSEEQWQRTEEDPIAPGEAGGYKVKSETTSLTGYLKPLRICNENEPRAANEKIVADIGAETGLNVPPVLLYINANALIGEEKRCCISLVLYPQIHEWGFIWNVGQLPEPVRLIVREALSRYSETFALDLLIGQTDRNNQRNVVLGSDNASPAVEFFFIDHASTLNYGNRWDNGGWRRIEIVPVPGLFRDSLVRGSVLEGADKLAAMPDGRIREMVERIPDDYMGREHKNIVMTGLNERKLLIRRFVEENF